MSAIIQIAGFIAIGIFIGVPLGFFIGLRFAKQILTYQQSVAIITTCALVVLLVMEAIIPTWNINQFAYAIFAIPIGFVFGVDITKFLPWRK